MYSLYNIYVVCIIYNTYKNFKAIDTVLEAQMVSKANLFIKNISLFFYRSFVRNLSEINLFIYVTFMQSICFPCLHCLFINGQK